MTGNCGTCEFFAAAPGATGARGHCNLNPPTAYPMPVHGKPSPGNPQGIGIAVQAVRPPVWETDGCGQWQGRSAANN